MYRHPHNGPSYTTVLVVRGPISNGLQLYLSVLLRTSMTDRFTHDGPSYGPFEHTTIKFSPSVHQRTYAADRRSRDGPSCTTVLVVRDLNPKGLPLFLSVL